jgi:cystathionine beta-lyase/cystathionine gamma-synthase
VIAARLRSHPHVLRVYHPGAGAIVSFEPKAHAHEDGLAAAKRVVKAMAHVPVVPSLGGVATTATHPASTSHRAVPQEMRVRLGVTDGLLRLSIGLEDPETLWREIEAACKF